MKNKIFIIGLLILLSLSFKNQALADAAPATPPYLSTHLNVKVGLGDFTDKYVIIEYASRYGNYYSLADTYVSPDGYGANTYFALDKNYFENNGGIDGLFLTTGADEGTQMSPKDNKSFDANIYNFIISRNDSLLNSKFGEREDETATIDNKYVKFPFKSDFYIRQGADDSDCGTGWNGGIKDCLIGEETLTYLPQQVVGNNILLVNAETLNQSSQEVSTPPQHISWWKKIWNFFISLF
ncbi:MAG: hypothetical protein ABH881_01120 [bacterium]